MSRTDLHRSDLHRTAIQYLQSLQRAGIDDLPNNSAKDLEKLVLQDLTIQNTPTDNRNLESGTADFVAEQKQEFRPSAVVPAQTASFQLPTDSEAYGPTLSKTDRAKALADLSIQVSQCTKCPELSSCRTRTVFGVGNSTPRLAFFGEGPGADEDRMGEPFVGRAGELLNKIIAACQMSREDVYIFNTVKCRPPANRNPHDAEIGNCLPYSISQLEILQPEFICCLGSVAAMTLLQTSESVGRLRGKFHKYRGSQVVVTYHPAYLLRTPAAKAKTWEDMKMLMEAMGIAF